MFFQSTITILFILLVAASKPKLSYADDFIFNDDRQRISAVKNGYVWKQPIWMNADFSFNSYFSLDRGPELPVEYELIRNPEVFCLQIEKDLSRGMGGVNPKFYCQLLNSKDPRDLVKSPAGKSVTLKVKYPYASGKSNPEVYGEVLGTRLLWALGFGADRMSFVERVTCYGCNHNPMKKRFLDSNTLISGQAFSPTAIEVKTSGTEMRTRIESKPDRGNPLDIYRDKKPKVIEGFSFAELMRNLPDDPRAKYDQYVQRDALRYLAVFVQHLDLKKDNQRIVCEGEVARDGTCSVSPLLYIQDIGSSFGVHVKNLGLDKVNLKAWQKPFWKNGASCKANFNVALIPDSSMVHPKLSEAGRQFFIKLMEGFAGGAEGRNRVTQLFEMVQIEGRGRGETIQMWVDAFYNRLNQVRFPMGLTQPEFECPF